MHIDLVTILCNFVTILSSILKIQQVLYCLFVPFGGKGTKNMTLFL